MRSAMTFLILCALGAPALADDAQTGPATGEAAETTNACARSPDPTGCLTSTAAQLPDFDQIRTPDSPAFALLGISPSKVDRPTTPKQLTATLGGFLSEGGLVIPKSLAVEFLPYWLFSQRSMSAEDYQNRGLLSQAVQRATISVGTTTTDRTMTMAGGMDTHSDTSLAVGARTFVDLSGDPVVQCKGSDFRTIRASPVFLDAARATAVTLDGEGRELTTQLAVAAQRLHDATKALEVARAARDRADARARDRAEAEVKEAEVAASQATDDMAKLQKDLQDRKLTLLQQGASDRLATLCSSGAREVKRGWVAELAVAWSEIFLDGKTSDRHHRDSALWATVAYEQPGWSAIAVARGLSTRVVGSDRERFFEGGVRVIRSKDSYAFSLELMGRAPDTTYRVAAAFDYHLQDNTWLTFSFGRDFASGDAGSLFSLANVKFGIGDPVVTSPKHSTD